MKVTLKAARINAGITLRKAARIAGCSLRKIQYSEMNNNIDAVSFEKLSPYYKCKFEDIEWMKENTH